MATASVISFLVADSASALGGVVGWIVAVPMLILILLAASAPDSGPPPPPSRKALRRHVWEKIVREEEREGVRPARASSSGKPVARGPEPQAKWSDRR
jgi:hypothetical protein